MTNEPLPIISLGAAALYVVADMSHEIATRSHEPPDDEALLALLETYIAMFRASRSGANRMAILAGALALYRAGG
jgi:hypothetical protein